MEGQGKGQRRGRQRTLDGYIYWFARVRTVKCLEFLQCERVILGREQILARRLHDDVCRSSASRCICGSVVAAAAAVLALISHWCVIRLIWVGYEGAALERDQEEKGKCNG